MDFRDENKLWHCHNARFLRPLMGDGRDVIILRRRDVAVPAALFQKGILRDKFSRLRSVFQDG